jgi:chromosome segregation ATPase
MMKRSALTLLILFSLSMAACKDQEAREYAARLIPVLDSYQEQLSQKIKAEQESYQELADNFESARKDAIVDDLAKERVVRSEELGEEIAVAKNAPTLTTLIGPVLKYGNHDFETTRALFQEALGARSRYLTELESLEIDLQKIKLLKQSLQELAKSKKDFQQLKAASTFLNDTHVAMEKLDCGDLKNEVEALDKELGVLDKEIAELNKKADENAQKIKVRIEAKQAVTDRKKSLSDRMATKECA